jgi:SAM-dependent methyltransferase
MSKTEWFAGWFDSPYYHLLYNHRDYAEADKFISNICTHLRLSPGATIWDLACGKGRHSLALSKRGYKVTGTDLSANSIQEASAAAGPQLEFIVHDMRTPFRENYFDAVFNLFTSIGYFTEFKDNFLVFKNISTSLKPGGYLVVDFFNSEKIKGRGPADYTEQRQDIVFHINKVVQDKTVVKKIHFETRGRQHNYEERVSLLLKDDFFGFATAAHLTPVLLFGNYDLGDFDEKNSDRLIIVFQKPLK